MGEGPQAWARDLFFVSGDRYERGGSRASCMGKGHIFMSVVIVMRAGGRRAEGMGKEFSSGQMGVEKKGIGPMIRNMAGRPSSLPLVAVLNVSMLMETEYSDFLRITWFDSVVCRWDNVFLFCYIMLAYQINNFLKT